jgi:hypothetical protein
MAASVEQADSLCSRPPLEPDGHLGPTRHLVPLRPATAALEPILVWRGRSGTGRSSPQG